MRFLAHQEREAPTQKGRPDSRLRRESREHEQISSFFHPIHTDKPSHKTQPSTSKDNEWNRGPRVSSRNDTAPLFHRNPFTTSSSPSPRPRSHHPHSIISSGKPGSLRTVTPSYHGYPPDSSRTTSYFTWSSTHRSSLGNHDPVYTCPSPLEHTRSVTPESAQKALAATGVYKNTGIYPYDVPSDQQQVHISITTKGGCTLANSAMGGREENQESEIESRHSNDTGAIVTVPTDLEVRWNKILSPAWRRPEMSPVDEQREVAISNTCPLSRQGIAQEARISPIRKISPVPWVDAHNRDYSTDCYSKAGSPILAPQATDQAADHHTVAVPDRAAIASRDAMPPPPIPSPRCKSSDDTIPKSGDQVSCLTRPATVRPIDISGCTSRCQDPLLIDTYAARGQPHERSSEPEKVIPTLDSASWIPQAATAILPNYERVRSLSRLSARSPIYEVQGSEKGPPEPLHPLPPRRGHLIESMAEFIARIESEAEVENQASLSECCEPESDMEDQEPMLDPRMCTYDTQKQFSMSEGPHAGYHQAHFGLTGGVATGGTLEASNGFQEYENPRTSVGDGSRMTPTERPRDDIDEFLEMSNFWRPNQFSQF